MKKNITINLCGRLFQIDEDAYELLQQYIESLRASFGKQEDGEEIANDIEERIAELFDELKANGTVAITIDHVKNIITRIGKPEQLAGEEGNEFKGGNNSRENGPRAKVKNIFDNVRSKTAGKRLYRNPNDKMLAGVLSGFAAYTGTDTTWWRIGYALLFISSNFFLYPLFKLFHINGFFFSFNITFIVFYILLAIAMPEAKKPKEVLQMEGKDVTPQNLAGVVVEDKDRRQPEQKGQMRGCLSVLLKMLVGLFVAIAAIFGLVLLICFLLIVGALIFEFTVPGDNHHGLPFGLGYLNLADTFYLHPWAVVIFIASLLLALFIPLYAIVHMLLSKAGKLQPMGTAQRIGWIVIWIVALLAIFPSIGCINDFNEWQRMEHQAEQNGWMTDVARDYLKKQNLQIEKRHHCYDDFVKSGQYFTGDTTVSYIDVSMWGSEKERYFQLSPLGEKVDSGTYRISCNARADGDGVCLFATAFNGSYKAIKTMPTYGNEGGNIWEEAAETVKSDSLPIAEQARKIREVNDGKGYGWFHVEMEVRIDGPTTLRYGISTNPKFTDVPCHANWFSVADFKLERVEE